MAKRARDPEATRASILEAAEELILEKGLGATAMSEIAAAAKVTKSLIHHHFGSKEALWEEIKRRGFEEYTSRQTALLDSSEVSLDLLLRSLETYFRFLQEHPRILKMITWMTLEELSAPHGESCCMEENLVSVGIVRIRDAQRAGLIRSDIEPIHVVIAFLAMAHSWFHDKVHFHKWLVPDMANEPSENVLDSRYLESITKILLTGIAPQS